METCWKGRKKIERNVHFGTLNFRIFGQVVRVLMKFRRPITEGESYKVREKQQQSESGQEGQADWGGIGEARQGPAIGFMLAICVCVCVCVCV